MDTLRTAPLRTALVGCGKVGAIHARVLHQLPESDLVAVCDTSAERAKALAQQYGGAAFDDLAQMLTQAQPQVVCVATPHPLHASVTIASAKAGAHVLVEKPLAATLNDCDAMMAATQAAGVELGVISQRRYYAPVLRMKQALDAGKIGQPILGLFLMYSWRDENYYKSDPWRGRWDSEGGGVLVNQSPHQLDILQWLMGPIEEISGAWANLTHPYLEVEDTAVATIRFASGGLGCILTSLCQQPGIYTKVHIHGSRGASIGVQTDTGATFVAGVSELAEPPLNDLWNVPGEEDLLKEFQEEDRQQFRQVHGTEHYHKLNIGGFLRAVADGQPPPISGEDGRTVVAMFQAIYQSQRLRQPVRFPL